MKILSFCFVLVEVFNSCRCGFSISTEEQDPVVPGRELIEKPYYFTVSITDSGSKLGSFNPDAAIGNPLKGLMGSPFYEGPPLPNLVPSTLEFYYIGLDSVMLDNPAKVGATKAFNWTYLEGLLNGSASRRCHAILRFYLDFPGQALRIPQYLLNAGVKLLQYNGTKISPFYGDTQLLEALKQFVSAFGQKYDGDTRLACVQLGLIGFWGEGHTFDFEHLLPTSVLSQVIVWYKEAFEKTKLQIRGTFDSAYKSGFGRHDDSFGYSTLDGKDNGGISRDWFFWPRTVAANQVDFWKIGPMGGETRPELQKKIFQSNYTRGIEYHQDFMRCVNTTHASWMFHHRAFRKSLLLTGKELENARFAHSRMGYNFVVAKVAVVASSQAGKVDVDVTLAQRGVAPFYYPLSLFLSCPDLSTPLKEDGAEKIISLGDTMMFTFAGVPATLDCLSIVSLSLDSPYIYDGRPIKFAQGSSGLISLKIPLPIGSPVRGWIAGVTLMDSAGSRALEIRQLEEVDTIDLAEDGKSLSLRADISGVVSKIVFDWGQGDTNTDFSAPYAMGGNSGIQYNTVSYLSTTGSKSISIKAFDGNTEIDSFPLSLLVLNGTDTVGVFSKLIIFHSISDKNLTTLQQGMTIGQKSIGTSVNIRADVKTKNVDLVQFRWGIGKSRQDTTPPFTAALKNNTQSLSFAYLGYPGVKNVEATAYYLKKVVGYLSISFTIL
jgi:hypothetical protein